MHARASNLVTMLCTILNTRNFWVPCNRERDRPLLAWAIGLTRAKRHRREEQQRRNNLLAYRLVQMSAPKLLENGLGLIA